MIRWIRLGFICTVFFAVALPVLAGNIDSTDKYAEGLEASLGSINFGTTEGDVTVSDTQVTGYAWGENVGWINLQPTNGGVSNTTGGVLSGYAWGENTGWINFNPTNGGVTIDTSTGIFSGYAWSENYGWISFNCADESTCGTNDYKVKTSWPSGGGGVFECNDGIDNDGDGLVDYPADPGCSSATDDSESNGGGGGGGGPSPEPDDPSDPQDPNDPPTSPPSDPNDPNDPPNPNDPDTPTDPNDPEQPTDPSDPEQPTDPTDPTDPPAGPNDPGSPSGPGGSGSGIPFITGITEVPQLIGNAQEFIQENPVVSGTIQTVTSAGAIGAVAGIAFSFGNILSALIRLWSGVLTFLGLRKKHQPWGTVYDSVTKQPLDPAYVVLTDLQGNEIQTSITDIDGRYGFLTSPGSYKMVANKTNYIFPSQRLAGKLADELYGNLYFGGELNIDEQDAVITKNIPLDPEKFDWNEFAKRDKGFMTFYSRFDRYFMIGIEIFFYLGLIVSIASMFLDPVLYNFAIFAFYILLVVLRIFGIKPRRHAYITDTTGSPLAFALVKIFTEGIDQPIAKKVTDPYGRYYALVPPGEYYLTVEKKVDEETYTHVLTSKMIQAKKGIIRKNFSL